MVSGQAMESGLSTKLDNYKDVTCKNSVIGNYDREFRLLPHYFGLPKSISQCLQCLCWLESPWLRKQ